MTVSSAAQHTGRLEVLADRSLFAAVGMFAIAYVLLQPLIQRFIRDSGSFEPRLGDRTQSLSFVLTAGTVGGLAGIVWAVIPAGQSTL